MSARINSLWMWEKKNRLRFDARMTALTLTLSVSLYLSVSLSHLRYRERLWANVLKKCLVKTTCSFLPFTVIGLEMNTTPIVPWRGDIAQWNSAGLVIWRSLVRPLAGTAGEISFPPLSFTRLAVIYTRLQQSHNYILDLPAVDHFNNT